MANNFLLEENGLASKDYFFADSFFQYVPCFLGMTLSIGSILNLNRKEDLEVLNNFKDSLIAFNSKYSDGINVCDYMYYYYCLKYMNLEQMRNLENTPELLEDYFTIENEKGKKQLLYTYIRQVTIYDEPGTVYYIAIADSSEDNLKIVRKEYTVGESGIIQFYNSKIFGIIPKKLLNYSKEYNGENYTINSTFLSIEDCPFEEEKVIYQDSFGRVDMTITTSELKMNEIQNENWQIPFSPDSNPDPIIVIPQYSIKYSFIDQVCAFLNGNKIGNQENSLCVFQNGSNISYLSNNLLVWNCGDAMTGKTSLKSMAYQYGEEIPEYIGYYSKTPIINPSTSEISTDYFNKKVTWSIHSDVWPYYSYYPYCSFTITTDRYYESIVDANGNEYGIREIPYIKKIKLEWSGGLLAGLKVSEKDDPSEKFITEQSPIYGTLPLPGLESRQILSECITDFDYSVLAQGKSFIFLSQSPSSAAYCSAFLSSSNRINAAHKARQFCIDISNIGGNPESKTLTYSSTNQSFPISLRYKNGELVTSCKHYMFIDQNGPIDKVEDLATEEFSIKTTYF